MMNSAIVFPILIPLLIGTILFFFPSKVMLQRTTSLFGLLLTVFASAHLIQMFSSEGIQVLHVGGWEAPFGIRLVVEMASALLLLASSVVGVVWFMYSFY